MKLSEFRVTMFKGVIDSGPVAVDALSVIVGKNESGKTTLLKALHKLNPATPEPYVIEREWPRGRRKAADRNYMITSRADAIRSSIRRERHGGAGRGSSSAPS